MTARTFKLQGQAYGAPSITISAKINGTEIFNGSIAALDQPAPLQPLSAPISTVTLFTWTADVSFSGTQLLEISVTNGTLLITDCLANYCVVLPETPGPTPLPTPYPTPESTGPDGFQDFNFALINGALVPAPFSDVTINGIEQIEDRTGGNDGEWVWTIAPSKLFAATVNVTPGVE